MAIYTSEYSGPEIDEAVGKVLGDKYNESADPGCHLIGKEEANPQNLYDVQLPGKYTILFYCDYYEDGDGNKIPIPLSNIASVPTLTGEVEYASIEGNSPIFMTVTYGPTQHYQRITIGAALFWRDLNSNNLNWTYVNMGVTQTVIVDHLHSTSASEALSGNMGRELKSIIDSLEIGNYNLISNSGLARDASCWNIPTYENVSIARDTNNKYGDHPTFHFTASGYTSTDYASIANSMAYDAPAIVGTTYTGSVYVKSTTDVDVFLQITFLDNTRLVPQGAETIQTTLSAGSWKRLRVSKENASGEFVRISFGIKGNSEVLFALPKIEAGYYATQWMPSYFDMWREYDNANYINEVLVDTDDLKHFDGLVYDEKAESYINYPVATGGGGGVVQSATAPAYPEVLWYKYDVNANRFYIYDAETDQWVRAFPPFFAQQDEAPADIERGWLDTRKASTSVPATLNYFDTKLMTWRPIGAAPGINWVFSDTPPENTGLIWIHTPNFIMKLWYDGAWVPIHAIWGTNITST